MFVINKIVEEDHRMLLANELESITLLNGTTQALAHAVRDAFTIFEDLCLLGNGEHPRFLQPEYLHKTFALELIKSVLTNYHQLFRKVSPPLYPSETCMPVLVLKSLSSSRHSELLLLLQHHLFPPAPQNALRTLRFPAFPPRHLCCLSLAQAILLQARDGGQSHPHTTHQTHLWKD